MLHNRVTTKFYSGDGLTESPLDFPSNKPFGPGYLLIILSSKNRQVAILLGIYPSVFQKFPNPLLLTHLWQVEIRLASRNALRLLSSAGREKVSLFSAGYSAGVVQCYRSKSFIVRFLATRSNNLPIVTSLIVRT